MKKILFIFITCFFLLLGCDRVTERGKVSFKLMFMIPKESKIIKVYNENMIKIEFDGQYFLCYFYNQYIMTKMD